MQNTNDTNTFVFYIEYSNGNIWMEDYLSAKDAETKYRRYTRLIARGINEQVDSWGWYDATKSQLRHAINLKRRTKQSQCSMP